MVGWLVGWFRVREGFALSISARGERQANAICHCRFQFRDGIVLPVSLSLPYVVTQSATMCSELPNIPTDCVHGTVSPCRSV
uniref:Putative secreted protein n=1 Tax=Anopheles marajoara TaxID=58244 RepID=A0A2M4CCD7_9DIPT